MKKLLPFIIICFISQFIFGQQENWLQGYTGDITGEVLTYHAPHPEVTTSLLLRNQDSTKHIAWHMEEIPQNTGEKTLTFVWIFGIDVNENPYPYRLYLDGKYLLTFFNPRDTLTRKWTISGREGSSLSFNASLVDKYGDLMGYAFLTLPVTLLKEGERPEVKITATSSDDPCWYMTHRYTMNSALLVKQMPAIMNTPEGECPVLRFDIHHFGERSAARITAAGKSISIPVSMGVNYTYFPVNGQAGDTVGDIYVTINGIVKNLPPVILSPVRPITLYLLHHSHSDIGYTHHQSEVEKLHHGFFREAVSLHDRTKSYPEGSRFKWNVEVCWAVESYLEQCSDKEKEDFIRVVREGGIGLDGLWANELTAICSPEELIQLIQRSAKIARMCGVGLRSAMITDIPGYTWSLVPVMAKSGIRYFSPGTNVFHRIGDIKDTLGDRPFYWVSQGGQDSVLTWVPEKGYSWFHTGLGSGEPKNLLTEEPLFEYISHLSPDLFPYDMSIIRYNIGSDNGPPHRALPDIVRDWNEKYVTPKLYIATTAEAFGIFENKYAMSLPSFAGDLTPYWEDGAASSARETAMVNASAERLEQALALWVLSGNRDFPFNMTDEAWKNILLFDEHTWGSWNSISAPHDPFTIGQWKTKQSFATRADSLTGMIMQKAMGAAAKAGDDDPIAFSIRNTHSWPVTDVVYINVPEGSGNVYASDINNNRLKSQWMSDGSLAVLLHEVPPFSGTTVVLKKETHYIDPLPGPGMPGFDISINKETGAIDSLFFPSFNDNIVDIASGYGLNSYIYVEGRDPANRLYAGKVKITFHERGALINSIRIESDAPGTDGLTTEIRTIIGLNRIDIINSLEKKEVYGPEGMHFAFPFNVPGGDVRVNLAWNYYRVGDEQLPGSNLNYSTMNRWVDVSNDEQGICMVSQDAPLVELGEVSMDAFMIGYKDHQEPTQTIFSYVMNNYWETNYLAAQPGKAVFRYSLVPHGEFDPVFNMKRALERTQPLIVLPSSISETLPPALFTIDNKDVLVTGLIPGTGMEYYLVRIYNPTDAAQAFSINSGASGLAKAPVSRCGLSGQDPVTVSSPMLIEAHDFQTLRIDF